MVLFSPLLWNDLFQRPQQMARALANRGYRVVYVQPEFVPLAHGDRMTKAAPNVWLLTLAAIRPYDRYREYPLPSDVQRWQKVCARYFPGARGVWQHLFWWELAAQWQGPTHYDCLDDHRAFAVTLPDVRERETTLVQTASTVTATDQRLRQRLLRIRPDVEHVPNGVELSVWREPSATHPLQALPRPRLLYFGALDVWFDHALVARLARRHREWQFVLVGPVSDPRRYLLASQANITFTGPVPYAELPSLAADADVGIIPFRLIPLILSTDPVKLYEMMAAGLPVVAAPLPSLVPHAATPRLRLARGTQAWERAIEEALSPAWRSAAARAQRRSWASKHDWSRRAQQWEQLWKNT